MRAEEWTNRVLYLLCGTGREEPGGTKDMRNIKNERSSALRLAHIIPWACSGVGVPSGFLGKGDECGHSVGVNGRCVVRRLAKAVRVRLQQRVVKRSPRQRHHRPRQVLPLPVSTQEKLSNRL